MAGTTLAQNKKTKKNSKEDCIYLGAFQSRSDVISEFDIKYTLLEGATLFLAWYGKDGYEGNALVVYEKDGKLFEVNASHCSCYGLGGKWKPEETSWEALAIRKPSFFGDYGTQAWATITTLAQLHIRKPKSKAKGLKPYETYREEREL